MSKVTKLLVMLLALVMVVSVFAGCTPTEDPGPETVAPTQPTTPTAPNTQPPTTTGKAPAIDNEMFPLKNPVSFRIAVRGQKEYQSMIERCEWYKYLCEKTNVVIECVVLGDDYMDTLNALVSTNFTPDAILGPDTLSSVQVLDLAEQGKLQALEEWVTDPKIMPNYHAALSAIPGAMNKLKDTNGHIWSLSSITAAPGEAWESPLTVNIEWLKQVPGYEDGKTFPKTVEEFTNVLRYFKNNDMNGNGDTNDEIPFLMVSSSDAGDAQATLQGLMNLWGLGTTDSSEDYYVVIQDDDKCTLAPMTQNYRDCLNWINIWWQEGLIWDKFFDDVSAETLNEVASAKTASWGFFNGAAWFNNGTEDNGDLAWRDAQTVAVPFSTGYDVNYLVDPATKGDLNTFTVFSSCKNPQILLAWLDQFFSLTGTQSAQAGLPNEWKLWTDADDYEDYYTKNPSWSIAEDGTLKHPQTENAAWVDLKTYNAELYTKKSLNHPTWNDIFNLSPIFSCITPEMYLNGQWELDQNSEAYVLGTYITENPQLFDYNAWPRPYLSAAEKGELDFLWASIKEICSRYEKSFITGELRLNDANWNRFQKELEYAGIYDLLAQLQLVWDRHAA